MATKKSTGAPRARRSEPRALAISQNAMERRIASGLKLRREQLAMSANDLAERSGVSRAMVSKIERLEVSPTAALLGRLCNSLSITLSSLIASAEAQVGPPVTRSGQQPTWRDPGTGLLRTMITPQQPGSKTELVQVELPAGEIVKYDVLNPPHYEQHVWVLQGKLTMTFGAEDIELCSGDCIRSRLDVPHAFANRTRASCNYLVVIVR